MRIDSEGWYDAIELYRKKCGKNLHCVIMVFFFLADDSKTIEFLCVSKPFVLYAYFNEIKDDIN